MADIFELVNELPFFVKGGEFLDLLRYRKFLNKDSSPWN
jgi:hypothetical protein